MRPFTNMHIMKKYILIFLCLITVSGSFAQMQDFKFKFYGQIRTDFYYNSRANEETVDGLFYMYPKDKVRDPEGNDLNSTPNSNFYTLYSRLGVDVAGPKLGTAKTSAKVVQSPNQKIPDRKTKCVIKTHINIKQNVIFSAKLKPV